MKSDSTNQSPSYQHGMVLKVDVRPDYGSLTLPVDVGKAIANIESPPIDSHGNLSPACPDAVFDDRYEDPARDGQDDPAEDWKR